MRCHVGGPKHLRTHADTCPIAHALSGHQAYAWCGPPTDKFLWSPLLPHSYRITVHPKKTKVQCALIERSHSMLPTMTTC